MKTDPPLQYALAFEVDFSPVLDFQSADRIHRLCGGGRSMNTFPHRILRTKIEVS